MKSKDQNQNRGMYIAVGMIVALSVTIFAFEWKTVEYFVPIESGRILTSLPDMVLPTSIAEPVPPKPKTIPVFQEILEEPELEIEIPELEMIDPNAAIPEVKIDIEPVIEEVDNSIILLPEKMPEPANGFQEFYQQIGSEIKYPEKARRLNIEGRVFIQFVVGKNGEISQVEVVRGIGGGCDEEAVRAMKIMPAWLPGKQRGRPVNVRMVIPINFNLH